MSFFKKLGRSRTNSNNSYVDEDWERSPQTDKGQENAHGQPPSSYKNPASLEAASPSSEIQQHDMYPRPSETRQAYDNPPSAQPSRTAPNGINTRGTTRDSGFVDSAPPSAKPELGQAPDSLTRAFHEAVRPHTERIEQLEQQVAELQAWNDQLEQQRIDIYAWIDKRGLRPDVPPNVAKHMDSHPDAAAALNAQLDRKITIVNFDLHRLQDDLNDTISSSHFGSAMTKFMPEIQRLSLLPTGGRYAFELIVKLAGNLNSHGGVEPDGTNDQEVREDRTARSEFYDRLDVEMEQVCRRRIAENEDWQVARDVKRMEKNGAYLKNYGVDPYFPRSLDLMRQVAGFNDGGNNPTQGTQRGAGY